MSTKTSEFGVSKRESHDSSGFYKRRLFNQVEEIEVQLDQINEFPSKLLDQIYHGDSRNLEFIPDNSVHLMITSPPYNVGKEYDENLSLEEYLDLIHNVMREVYRVLIPGGRACINIANVGRKPYIPIKDHINQVMLNLGFLMRGEIIWDKGASAGGSCAWGSWKSASNPVLRDIHEYIMVFSKQSYARQDNKLKTKKNSITRDEFLEYTKSIWSFSAESAKRVKHPAPFPVELPYRLIQLYSFEDDVILDPFCGSGSTCLAALQTKRRYIGVDNNLEYVKGAQSRLATYLDYGEDLVESKKD